MIRAKLGEYPLHDLFTRGGLSHLETILTLWVIVAVILINH